MIIERCYLEISNTCNLSCSFCHKTRRGPRMMSEDEFRFLCARIKGSVKYLYLHLLGEPLIHPKLCDFIKIARENGMGVIITTNGTLLGERADELTKAAPHKVSVSLHAPEANGAFASDEYMRGVIGFARKASKDGIFVVLRLWNEGGLDLGNASIVASLESAFGEKDAWVKSRSGYRVADRVFLEFGERFDWPDMSAQDYGDDLFCYALREQFGILCDGTVVPCCLDADGEMALGNLFDSTLDEILSSPRAKAIFDNFTRHKAIEPLCRRCGYAAKTKRHREQKS